MIISWRYKSSRMLCHLPVYGKYLVIFHKCTLPPSSVSSSLLWTAWHWISWQHALPRHLQLSTSQPSVTSQKTSVFLNITVRTSNLLWSVISVISVVSVFSLREEQKLLYTKALPSTRWKWLKVQCSLYTLGQNCSYH